MFPKRFSAFPELIQSLPHKYVIVDPKTLDYAEIKKPLEQMKKVDVIRNQSITYYVYERTPTPTRPEVRADS